MDITTISLTMSSREIADLTGKEHFHVMRDTRSMLGELSLSEVPYIQSWIHPQNGQTYEEFALPKELTITLIAGYSAVARLRIVQRWLELERHQAGGHDLETEEGKLLLIKQLAEQRLIALKDNKRLTIERDAAIATKALIGSRREATAMQAAAAAKKAVARLQEELGRSSRHATVTAVQNAAGRAFGDQDWRALKRWCSEHGTAPEQVPDKRYGHVKAWPAGAWMAVYGVDLIALFPSSETEAV